MKRIKKNDIAIIKTGKSKGHVGKILKVSGDKVLVEGANIVTKAIKPNPHKNKRGELRKQEAFLHCSNVALYNPASKKADKVGFRFVEAEQNGGKAKRVRYFKSDNTLVEQSGGAN